MRQYTLCTERYHRQSWTSLHGVYRCSPENTTFNFPQQRGVLYSTGLSFQLYRRRSNASTSEINSPKKTALRISYFQAVTPLHIPCFQQRWKQKGTKCSSHKHTHTHTLWRADLKCKFLIPTETWVLQNVRLRFTQSNDGNVIFVDSPKYQFEMRDACMLLAGLARFIFSEEKNNFPSVWVVSNLTLKAGRHFYR